MSFIFPGKVKPTRNYYVEGNPSWQLFDDLTETMRKNVDAVSEEQTALYYRQSSVDGILHDQPFE